MRSFRTLSFKQWICLILYYGFAYYLPDSYGFGGKLWNGIRVFLCKRLFKKCGHIRTINRKVHFSTGSEIEIGDESGIGANTQIPYNTIIGNHTIVSRNIFILNRNHEFGRTDIPINEQGFKPDKQTIIEDDCWLGMNSLYTPGRTIKKGTIIAMGSVLTKDFPEYSIVGGNPAKLLKSRINIEDTENTTMGGVNR